MSILETRIDRRSLGGITLGVAATAGLGYMVSAQDATPVASPVAEGPAPLSDLENVTHVGVVAMDSSYRVYQGGGLGEGWYVFTMENQSAADASLNLALLPEGVTVSDFNSHLFQMTSGQLTELPEWYADAVFAGGTVVPVGGTGSCLVNLEPGEWVMFSSNSGSKQSSTTLKVLTAQELQELYAVEPVATPEVAPAAPEGFGSTFTVSVGDAGISADAMPSAGANIIGVRNDGVDPADLVILHSAEGVDPAGIADMAKAWVAGEATDLSLVGGMGALSPDKYAYFELNAEGGMYVAFSSLPAADGTPQVDNGVILGIGL